MIVNFEHTDTFGGEANYCWVNRETRELPSRTSSRTLVLYAKRFAGLTGKVCRVDHHGDMIAIYPRHLCQVVFVTFGE